MPPIVILLLICIVAPIVTYQFVKSNRQEQASSENQAQQKELLAQVEQLKNTVQQLEKRLSNVETIVTDAKFIDPPTTGREAINLQAEIADLKKIIQNLR